MMRHPLSKLIMLCEFSYSCLLVLWYFIVLQPTQVTIGLLRFMYTFTFPSWDSQQLHLCQYCQNGIDIILVHPELCGYPPDKSICYWLSTCIHCPCLCMEWIQMSIVVFDSSILNLWILRQHRNTARDRSKKISRKQLRWNHFSLVSSSIFFVLIKPSTIPSSTRHHAVDKELEEAQKLLYLPFSIKSCPSIHQK